VAGRFRLYTDADIDGPVVTALKGGGWDVLRGIDAYPERTPDLVHFERAVNDRRVLVSNDVDMKAFGEKWFEDGKRFTGLIWWPRSHYRRMTPGDFVRSFEDLAPLEDPFSPYSIVYIKPKVDPR